MPTWLTEHDFKDEEEEPFYFDVQLNRGPAGTTINDERANEFRRYLERKHAQERNELSQAEFAKVFPERLLDEPEVEEKEERPMTLFERVFFGIVYTGAFLYFVALIAFFIWIVLQGPGPGIWDRY